MKIKAGIILAVVMVCSVFLINNVYAEGAKPKKVIALKKYPDFKLGFLANNFVKALPPSKDNLKKIFDWASAQGFSWVELRDAKGTLTYEEAKELAAYAAAKNIEVIYSFQIGLLDPKFNEIFYRACANAALFRGPRVIRTVVAGPEFQADPNKATWTKEEFDKLLDIANNAANIAKLMGLQFVVENTYESMQGNGTTTFGIADLFMKGNGNIGSQYDAANFFTLTRTRLTPEVAKGYFEKHANRTYYMHVKTSTKEHKSPAILSDSELDFGVIFDSLTKAKVRYLAVELPPQERFEDCANNLIKSIDYLKSKY